MSVAFGKITNLKKGKLNETEFVAFAKRVYSPETKFCGFCNEYKGLMTIADFDNYYGERIL
jgi:hypothetical protein